MDFFGVLYLYTFHNDIIRNLNMDHWLQNPLPAIGDSGLIFVTADNVDTILEATDPASPKAAPAGLDVPFSDPSRSDQEYVWISNASNLPLLSSGSIRSLESARKALNVNVRIAGPTAVDLAFITTVDAECTKNPAGVIVVRGWDDALASEVDKCIDKQVPTIVTDGDLPMSKRLTYLGTNWYNLGYQHGQYQCRYHAEAGLEAGEIGDLVPCREQLHPGAPGPARRAGGRVPRRRGGGRRGRAPTWSRSRPTPRRSSRATPT